MIRKGDIDLFFWIDDTIPSLLLLVTAKSIVINICYADPVLAV